MQQAPRDAAASPALMPSSGGSVITTSIEPARATRRTADNAARWNRRKETAFAGGPPAQVRLTRRIRTPARISSWTAESRCRAVITVTAWPRAASPSARSASN